MSNAISQFTDAELADARRRFADTIEMLRARAGPKASHQEVLFLLEPYYDVWLRTDPAIVHLLMCDGAGQVLRPYDDLPAHEAVARASADLKALAERSSVRN